MSKRNRASRPFEIAIVNLSDSMDELRREIYAGVFGGVWESLRHEGNFYDFNDPHEGAIDVEYTIRPREGVQEPGPPPILLLDGPLNSATDGDGDGNVQQDRSSDSR